MIETPLCPLLRIRIPLLNAPLGGGISGPELAAAVTNAGGFGFLGMVALPPPVVREQIRRTRSLTTGSFGANVVLDNPEAPAQIEVCLEERVVVLGTFWGDVAPWVGEAHRRGIKVVPQIGSVEEAVAAAEAGADAIIAQGVEAGGHVRGTTSLAILLPAVIQAVKPLPVIAAGGIADAAGFAGALRLGAQGVAMGTRFLASDEAHADRRYKERIVAAAAEDTVLDTIFDVGWPGAPSRVLRNRAVREWEAAGRPPAGRRPGEGTIIGRIPLGGEWMELPKYGVPAPLPGFEGDLEDFCLYAGESCERIHDIRPAAAIVASIVADAEALVAADAPDTRPAGQKSRTMVP